jgi:hypothetical protein
MQIIDFLTQQDVAYRLTILVLPIIIDYIFLSYLQEAKKINFL